MAPGLTRRTFLKHAAMSSALGLAAGRLATHASSDQTGPFQPSWASLTAQYRPPDWFRDAKFGIWAHWSAQCVPEQGDWYARKMYVQGDRFYESHVRTYGHPSRFGFMEIENLWKAERWDPEALLRLYQRAGAKYFVALANHHDNFDAFDSRHHAWNSVNIGPKRDIVGTWARIARDLGLRFGVSNHSSHAWHWYQVAYGYDGEGPLAGVRYDAYNLTRDDGAGKWWEGLDPQELYTGRNMVIPDGIRGAAAVLDWHNKNDRVWTEDVPPDNPRFVEKWLLRFQDLVDRYTPDLVYLDNTELPFGDVGLKAAAHFYNRAIARTGRLDVVLNAKKMTDAHRTALVPDIERGVATSGRPEPWQTDTCIGGWHYERRLFDEHRYKTVDQVLTMLVDIVSKNGNLLLSIPMRGDGTIDSDEVSILEGMATWFSVNGEAIYGTRPWRTFGEGPSTRGPLEKGEFGEAKDVRSTPYTGEDLRFTTKGGTLFVFVLGNPTRPVLTITELASRNGAAARPQAVSLVGSGRRLEWEQTSRGLEAALPTEIAVPRPFAIAIEGLPAGSV